MKFLHWYLDLLAEKFLPKSSLFKPELNPVVCDRPRKGACALLFLIIEQEIKEFSFSSILQWVFFTTNIFSSLKVNKLLSCWLKYEAKESILISSF